MADQYDLIVFGGGNAITVATRVAAAGRKVALVEKGPLGGTCPNRGCIPSKLLLGHADVAQTVRDASRFHIQTDIRSIDADAMLRDTLDYIGAFDGSIAKSLPETLTHYRAHGRFVDNHTLEVDGQRITAPRIVLATGSKPNCPEIPGLTETPFWSSDEVFQITRAPRSITVVGGGFIGCELAYFFHAVGVETTLVQRGPELLAPEDDDIREVFMRGFPVPVRYESQVTKVSHDGARYAMEITDGGGSVTQHTSEAFLCAVGRSPNTDDIGLDTTDLETDARGFVRSDDRLRTPVDGIYSMGDVAGVYMFTHAASREAEWLADQILRDADDPIDLGPMPHAVFTHPEIAAVGETEQQLKARGADYLAASVPYTAASKGRAVKEEHGLCKFLIDREGKILGCHIVGHQASVLVHEVIPVMKWRNHISSLTEIIHIHPSLSEVVRGGARKAAALLD